MQIIHQAPLAALGLGAAFTVLWGVADPMAAFAEVKTLEADGYYIMGDGPEENQAIAKERARSDAKRAAAEKAGVYVESLSEVKMGQLTRDEIRTIFANVLEVQSDTVTPEVMGGTVIRYHCHMVARVDSSNIAGELRQSRAKLDEAVQRNMELEKEVARVKAEMAALKERYAKAGSAAEKEEIQQEVRANESEFESNQWVLKGLEQNKKGDKDGALRSYQKALELNPRNTAAMNVMGIILTEKGEYRKAIEIYQSLQRVDPSHIPSYNNIGVAYTQMGEYRKAIPYYEKALSMDWGNLGNEKKVQAYANLGKNYNKLEDYPKALEQFRKAMDISPNNAVVYGAMGRNYYDMGEYRTAIKHLEKAVALKTNDCTDYVNLGNCYNELENYPKAITAFRKALEIDSNDVDAYGGLGSAYAGNNQPEKAVECYTKAIEYAREKEDLYYAYLFRCTSNVKLKRLKEALRDANKALEIDPNGEDSDDLRELRDSLMEQVDG